MLSAEIAPMRVVTINAPDWYERDDFRLFLNSSCVATWHTQGEIPHEFSDVFVTYDRGDGSNAPEIEDPSVLPDDIWEAICQKMTELGVDYAIVWIRNLNY
jgi:hypothetical protein